MLRPGVKRWAAAPVFVSVVIYGLLFWYASTQVEAAIAWVDDAIPAWLTWLGWILWLVFWAAALGLMTLTFVLVVSIVASPFNGPLAAATERSLTGRGPAGADRGVLVALPLLLVQESKKVLYAVVWSIPFLILFLVPVVNVVAPVLWFLWNAWVATLAFTDYVMDNNGLLFREMRQLLGRHKMAAWGFGGAAFLALTIPILNLFAVPAAVCGGTLLWMERLKSARVPA